MIELFVTASGIENPVALAMYDVLRNSLTQTDAAGSAILATLSDPARTTFAKIKIEFDALRRKRDKMAHGLWGVSPHAPEHLVLVDAKRWITWASRNPQRYNNGHPDRPPTISGPQLIGLEIKAHGLPFEVEAWEEPDFYEFKEHTRALGEDLRTLCFVALDIAPVITRVLSEQLTSLPERRKMTQEHIDFHRTHFSAYGQRLARERLEKRERRAQRQKPSPEK